MMTWIYILDILNTHCENEFLTLVLAPTPTSLELRRSIKDYGRMIEKTIIKQVSSYLSLFAVLADP